MDIGAWLREIGLANYARAFEDNGIDATLLPELTNEDLKDLGIARLGDRKRLLKAIATLSEGGGGGRDKDEASSRGSYAGERRQVTILFVDLAGFTELSTALDPEELHGLVAHFYEVADGIVERYGGAVDKHLGDGVMALFGAPRAHGDDPLRAARAAFDIHQAMPALSAEAGRDLSIHAGIASGEVVAGGLGRDGHQEYTVLGDSVNLASRLDGLANPGETLIADAVRRAVEGQVDCEPLGEVRVKGLDEPVRVWRARSLLDSGASVDGGRGPFVGRRGELRQFSSLLASCKEDRAGHAVLIRGEAGIGKTRLVEEFAKIGETEGFAKHRSLVLDFGVGKGQDAIRALVRSLLDVVGGDDAARAAAADAAIAAGWLEADQRVFLTDLLDLPQPTELRAMYDAMDNATRNRGKRRAVADLVGAASARRPALLIIEDVHWADTPTLDHLAEIAAAARDGRAIMVMTTRIEGDPLDSAWRGSTHGCPLVTIDLGPLRRDEALALADELMDAPRSTALRCIERAEGNPLFLEQLLRNAEESEDEAVPASIQSLVLARMDRLPARDKDALQGASVIGQRFALDILRHLIDDSHYACAGLIDQFLIRPEGEDYLFAHALIQEGVYSSLLKKRRRALHRRAANWFAERDPVLMAEHLDRAEDPAAPAAYLDAAKAQAERYHYERAMRLIERGLALATAQTDRFALICAKGRMLHDLGSIDQSIEAYGDAFEMAEDDTERCRAWLGLAAGMRIADRYDEALAVLDKAEAVAHHLGLARERAEVHHIRGNLYFPMGRIEDCATEHGKSLRHARESGSAEAEVHALSGMADASYVAGRMATAFRYFGRCVGVARQNGFGRIEVANRSMVGFSRLYLNQLREALEDGLETVAAAAKVGHQRAETLGETLATLVLYEMAEYVLARQHNARALALARQLGTPRFAAQALMYEGKLARAEGRREDALRALKEALRISEEIGHGFAGPRIMGEFARGLDDPRAKRAALAEGECMLRDGSVGHNHFYFYADAIETVLETGDWDEAERYATALEDFTRPEPLPWSAFFIARARTLATWGRGRREAEQVAGLQRLRDEAKRVDHKTALTALDKALTAA